MDSRLKARLDKISAQLDRDIKKVSEGDIDSVISKYAKRKNKKKISKRKEAQFESLKMKFNDWVDEQVSIKSKRLKIKGTKEEQYGDLRIADVVPKKETRDASHFSKGNISRKNALAGIEHAINRMNILMSRQGQGHKTNMSKEAFLTAFNLPGGSVEYNQLRNKIMSMNQDQWEEFAWNNRKMIGRIWEWYHQMMRGIAEGIFDFLIPEAIPAHFITDTVSAISKVKANTAKLRRAKFKALTGISIPTAKKNPVMNKARRKINQLNVSRQVTKPVRHVKREINSIKAGGTTVKRVKRIYKKVRK